jgi:Protein of unknown function (DUF1549)
MSMHRRTHYSRAALAASLTLVAAYGCERSNPYKLAGDASVSDDCPPVGNQNNPSGGEGASNPTGGVGAGSYDPNELDARVVDYGEALRTASLKLVGNLPTLDQVYTIRDTAEEEQPGKYAEMVDTMLADQRFTGRMIEYWRNVFKMYGENVQVMGQPAPSRETAPVFAAQLMIEGRPWTDLLTASANTCPTYDPQTNSFAPAECGNGIGAAGVLTDPGIHSLYFGNLAFRRNRFFHEVFLCRNGNAAGGAEPTSDPSVVGACGEEPPPNYNSPWPMTSITSPCNGGQVDFHEYNTTTVCANCHSTWNHRAPLFANFDRFGMYFDTPQVLVPVEGSPTAVRTDWLPDGEPTAWKFEMPANDLSELGQVMANDPEVIGCAVKRVWNYAMSRGDIVDNETPVPGSVVAEYVDYFENNNYDLKATLREMLLSEDFVSF